MAAPLHSTPVPTSPRRTCLSDAQSAVGARFIDFGGWDMPVQFTSIIDEHQTVRKSVGVFDISHMGEIFVSGAGAHDWLQKMLSNDVSKCAVGSSQYTFLLNENGGVIDDLIVYRLEEQNFLLLVNASKIEEDFAWLTSHYSGDIEITDRSCIMGGLAIQGPQAAEVFQKLFAAPLPARNTCQLLPFEGAQVIAAGTGYTGEPGFELFFPAAVATKLWSAVLSAGAKPCGLGARDTLRLEMCYPLNGSDLSPERSPLEAGLGIFVCLDKPDFIGREALLAQKAQGLSSKLAALMMTEKSPPPRAHYPVLEGDKVVGETTSGVLSPSLGEGIALAYLPPDLAQPGQKLHLDIRGRKFAAEVVKKPFYRPSSAHL